MLAEAGVESKLLFLIAIASTRTCSSLLFDSDLQCVLVNDGYDRETTDFQFSLTHRPHAAVHPDLPFQVLNLIMQLLSLIRFILVLVAQLLLLLPQSLQLVEENLLAKLAFLSYFFQLGLQLTLCGLHPILRHFFVLEKLLETFLLPLLLFDQLVTLLKQLFTLLDCLISRLHSLSCFTDDFIKLLLELASFTFDYLGFRKLGIIRRVARQ